MDDDVSSSSPSTGVGCDPSSPARQIQTVEELARFLLSNAPTVKVPVDAFARFNAAIGRRCSEAGEDWSPIDVEEGRVDLRNRGLNVLHVNAIASAIREVPIVRSIDLRDNGLRDVDLWNLLSVMRWQARVASARLDSEHSICLTCRGSVGFRSQRANLGRCDRCGSTCHRVYYRLCEVLLEDQEAGERGNYVGARLLAKFRRCEEAASRSSMRLAVAHAMREIDDDQDGTVTLSELRMALAALGTLISERNGRALLKCVPGSDEFGLKAPTNDVVAFIERASERVAHLRRVEQRKVLAQNSCILRSPLSATQCAQVIEVLSCQAAELALCHVPRRAREPRTLEALNRMSRGIDADGTWVIKVPDGLDRTFVLALRALARVLALEVPIVRRARIVGCTASPTRAMAALRAVLQVRSRQRALSQALASKPPTFHFPVRVAFDRRARVQLARPGERARMHPSLRFPFVGPVFLLGTVELVSCETEGEVLARVVAEELSVMETMRGAVARRARVGQKRGSGDAKLWYVAGREKSTALQALASSTAAENAPTTVSANASAGETTSPATAPPPALSLLARQMGVDEAFAQELRNNRQATARVRARGHISLTRQTRQQFAKNRASYVRAVARRRERQAAAQYSRSWVQSVSDDDVSRWAELRATLQLRQWHRLQLKASTLSLLEDHGLAEAARVLAWRRALLEEGGNDTAIPFDRAARVLASCTPTVSTLLLKRMWATFGKTLGDPLTEREALFCVCSLGEDPSASDAILIQAHVRTLLVRRSLAANLGSKRAGAAVVLQAAWRGTLARNDLRRKMDSALVIQRAWRTTILQSKVYAAVVLQNAVRSHFARIALAVARRHAAAAVLQRLWRRRRLRARVREWHAARMVQAVYRGCYLRRNLSRAVASQWSGEERIISRAQRSVKRWHWRRLRAATRLQAAVRGGRARAAIHLRHARATRIQCAWRALAARHAAATRKSRIVALQSLARRRLGRRKALARYHALLRERHPRAEALALRLQRFWRQFWRSAVENAAAVLLQARLRGVLVRIAVRRKMFANQWRWMRQRRKRRMRRLEQRYVVVVYWPGGLLDADSRADSLPFARMPVRRRIAHRVLVHRRVLAARVAAARSPPLAMPWERRRKYGGGLLLSLHSTDLLGKATQAVQYKPASLGPLTPGCVNHHCTTGRRLGRHPVPRGTAALRPKVLVLVSPPPVDRSASSVDPNKRAWGLEQLRRRQRAIYLAPATSLPSLPRPAVHSGTMKHANPQNRHARAAQVARLTLGHRLWRRPLQGTRSTAGLPRRTSGSLMA